MSDATTPYLKGPNEEPVPADQMPTLRDASPRSTPPPFQRRRFAEYDLLSEIARGGMGVVYKANQIGLNRIVALKMILAGKLANRDDVARFHDEAEAAAKLQHPNIVAVFEVGEAEGQHYFSMEYIDGDSLSRILDRGHLPSRQAARYLRTLAEAVHYAHKHGVIHRDLKPSNILIDGADQPHITDFGLAKQVGADNDRTRTGTVLGTPSYMAPEQAEGRTREVGPSADVYSLGAILYECLTGRPPFKNDSVYDTVRQVIHDSPTRPRDLNADVDEDIELICMKCLEKEPSLRYADAQALAADLARYLAGEDIEARSLNVIDRITRMLDRSHHDFAFHTWSSMLFVMAGVILIEHIAVFFLMRVDAASGVIFSVRFLQYVILVVLFYANRGDRLLPTTAAERELWSIWIGYFLAYSLAIFATRTLGFEGIIRPDADASLVLQKYLPELFPYPFISLLSGLAFFVMGANYWGRCYAIGVVFFLLAAAMPMHLEWAPLLFGAMWSVALGWLAWHLETLAKKAAAERK